MSRKADRLQKGCWTTEAVVQSLPIGQPPKGRTGEASLAAQHLKERHKETGPSAGSVGSCDLARTARRGTQRDNTGAQAQALRGDCVSPPPKGRESNSSSLSGTAERAHSSAVRVCWKPTKTNSRPHDIPCWFKSAKAGRLEKGSLDNGRAVGQSPQPNRLPSRRTGKASFAAQHRRERAQINPKHTSFELCK